MQKIVALTLTALMLSFAVLVPAVTAQGPGAGPGITVPISTADFIGTLTIRAFRVVNGGLAAVGTVVGTALTGPNAGTTFVRAVTIPVIDITQGLACEILDLRLGPLDLDLLGLVVHLDEVHLNITAEPGAGNLLGNLLCAIAGLLDPGPGQATNLQQLVALLNQVLRLL